MIWTSVEQIIMIHSKIIEKTGGLDGIRDMNALESAFHAPMQTFDREELFKTDIEKIVRLGFGLSVNHAFIDGNKRIGAMMTQLLLKWNDYEINLKQGELADMFIGIADGKVLEKDLLEWIIQKLYK